MSIRWGQALRWGLGWLMVLALGCDADDETASGSAGGDEASYEANTSGNGADNDEESYEVNTSGNGASANALPSTQSSSGGGSRFSSSSSKSAYTSNSGGAFSATGTGIAAGPERERDEAPISGTGGSSSQSTTAAAGAAAAAGSAPVDQCGLLDASKPLQLYLSADDSNSMASPTIARSIIEQGGVPPASMIRTYEFLNYYDLKYERAGSGQLALSLEMAPGDGLGTYALQIGVSSEAAAYVRRPMSITFVLDTSGSMSGAPIERSRAAIKAVAASLKAGDTVSAVTWNDQNTVELDSHTVAGPDDPVIVALADAMQANGSTNLNAGLTVGYQIAQKNFVAEHLNRVVLISDGQANTGVTDKDIIAQGAGLNDGDGIYLVGVGVGNGVNDTLMDSVTDKGRGAYVYLDSVEEAAKILTLRFDETMDVAARAVQVRLDLPWYLGVARFYGEELSTNPNVIEPQHLAPNDAMVFNQVLRPCAADRFVETDAVTVTANWTTPTTHEPRTQSVTTSLGALLAASSTHLPKAQAIIAYAEALKAGSTSASIALARTKLSQAMALGADPDLVEIDSLLQKLDALRR